MINVIRLTVMLVFFNKETKLYYNKQGDNKWTGREGNLKARILKER